MRRLAFILLVILVAGGATWGSLFLLYRVPGGVFAAGTAAALFGALALAALVGLRIGRRWPLAIFVLGLVAIVVAFALRRPQADLDWAPEVSRPLRSAITADAATVEDVRGMEWSTATEGTPHWSSQVYRLDDIRTIDLINSYWAGPIIAHTLLSFGFADGRYLVFSIEIRRRVDQEYSNIAGFFREYELVYIAAEERDIIRVRTSLRNEDVQLYRVRADRAQVRAMFLTLLSRANAIANNPTWYNTLTANCTTEMFSAASAVAPSLPFDWRVIVSGFLPEYTYDEALLDRRLPFPALREASRVSPKAISAGDVPDFSARIREGLPDPNR